LHSNYPSLAECDALATAANLIIDASNFDFLDYLPELNSTTIDQTITTATSHIAHITLDKSEPLDLLDAAAGADLSPWF
jgi:hypothetical protein